jgi:hypothetical protein
VGVVLQFLHNEASSSRTLAEEYRHDPSVAVIVISADSHQHHERARAVLADIAPDLASYYVVRESDIYPLLPRRPSGTPVVSLPMTLVIDAKGTWHYTYGGAGTDEHYVAEHRKLVDAAQTGTLEEATDPPPKTVAIEIRPSGGTGYQFKVVRAPKDTSKIVEALLGVMKDALGYPEQSLESARIEIERGLLAGRIEFAFELPPDAATSDAESGGSE